MKKIKIAIIDDNKLHRDTYKCHLDDSGEMEVISEDCDGESGFISVRSKCPDIVFLDFQLTGITGVETARKIKNKNKEVKIFSLTSHRDPCIIERMIEEKSIDAVGIKGSKYLSDNFLYIVQYILDGHPFLDPQALDILRTNCKDSGVNELTGREFEVLIQSGIGRSDEDISCSLNVDVMHIRNIKSKIKKKLCRISPENLIRALIANK